MDKMIKLLISASLCFAIAKSGFLGRQRRGVEEDTIMDNPWACYEERSACREELMAFGNEFDTFEGFKRAFSSKPRLQEFCRILQNTYTCIEQWERETTCDYNRHRPESYQYGLISGYICRESSQDLIVDAMGSPCLDNETAAESAIESTEVCGFVFVMSVEAGNGPADVCPALLAFGGCVLNAAQEKCGSSMRALVQDEFDYLIEVDAPGTFYNMIADVPADFSCLAEQAPVPPAKRSLNLFNFFKS